MRKGNKIKPLLQNVKRYINFYVLHLLFSCLVDHRPESNTSQTLRETQEYPNKKCQKIIQVLHSYCKKSTNTLQNTGTVPFDHLSVIELKSTGKN